MITSHLPTAFEVMERFGEIPTRSTLMTEYGLSSEDALEVRRQCVSTGKKQKAHRQDLEGMECRAFMQWVELQIGREPRLRWLHHIPNGRGRTRYEAAMLKAEGARKGVWDYFLPAPSSMYAGLYIEFKDRSRRTTKQGGLTDEQVEFGVFVARQGYFTAVAYSADEAIQTITAYLKRAPTIPNQWQGPQ